MSHKDEAFINNFSHIYDHFIDIYNSFNKKQSQFQATVAHEIKNPLAVINSMLQLVEKKVPKVKETSYWDSIFSEIEYLNKFLNNLTFYCRSIQVKKEPLALNHILQDIKNAYTSYAIEQNKTFALEQHNDKLILEADPIKLKQALSNIIKNAFEATHEGDHISLCTIKKDSSILINIEDTGKGMSPNQLDTIFDPFITYKTTGTGLGLSIVKNIIKEHNGSIYVASEPGKGTTFSIELPVSISLQTVV